jgi:hypothetical protein
VERVLPSNIYSVETFQRYELRHHAYSLYYKFECLSGKKIWMIVLGSLNSGEAAVDILAYFLGWCGEHLKLTRRWAPNEHGNSMEEELARILQKPVLTNKLALCLAYPVDLIGALRRSTGLEMQKKLQRPSICETLSV